MLAQLQPKLKEANDALAQAKKAQALAEEQRKEAAKDAANQRARLTAMKAEADAELLKHKKTAEAKQQAELAEDLVRVGPLLAQPPELVGVAGHRRVAELLVQLGQLLLQLGDVLEERLRLAHGLTSSARPARPLR